MGGMEDRRYTDLVREDFDRIADLSEAEGWDRRVPDKQVERSQNERQHHEQVPEAHEPRHQDAFIQGRGFDVRW